MNPARDPKDPPNSSHPRLWCPGLVFVTPAGDVQLGRRSGYNSNDPSFARLRCGHSSSLAHWTHVAWLVQRSALTASVVHNHAIVLPESLVDRDALPHAYRWLHEQHLLCVSGATWRRLESAGVPLFHVALDATGDRLLHIESSVDSDQPATLTVALDALERAAAAAAAGSPLLDVQGHPSPIDRALRLLSGGVLDESSVLNAFDARGLVEEGYGYRGAPEGRYRPIESVVRALRPLDALFGQIFARAKPLRMTAERLLTALSHAPRDATTVPVPLYGTAHRILVPALRVPQVAELIIGGRQLGDLDLSSERRWSVEGVDAWSPRLPAHLAVPAPH